MIKDNLKLFDHMVGFARRQAVPGEQLVPSAAVGDVEMRPYTKEEPGGQRCSVLNPSEQDYTLGAIMKAAGGGRGGGGRSGRRGGGGSGGAAPMRGAWGRRGAVTTRAIATSTTVGGAFWWARAGVSSQQRECPRLPRPYFVKPVWGTGVWLEKRRVRSVMPGRIRHRAPL